MTARLLMGVCAMLLVGCSDDSDPAPVVPVEQPPEEACPPPNRVVGEGCIEPGVQDNGCPAGTLGLDDGTCQPAGVPPELCAEGFVHDGDAACEPILPPDRCPPGQMAVPGETACRPVMDCGTGRWGDIPVDGATIYVDAAYTGGMSDGSEQQPYVTISAAVAGAPRDALIAIAAGSYDEDVAPIRPVRLWGVCPDRVAITGAGVQPAPLRLGPGADGSEVRGMAITGGSVGIIVSGAVDVLVDSVHVHDALGRGVNLQNTLGATSITLSRSLIEGNQEHGVYVSGSQATLDGVVVRGTQPRQSDQQSGRGISIQAGSNEPASATITNCVVEDNHEVGVYVFGSQVTLDGSVVRNTLPQASDQLFGRGLDIGLDPNIGAPTSVAIISSLVEGNRDAGVFAADSMVTLDGVVVRDTLPRASDDASGRGVNIQLDPVADAAASAAIHRSLIEDNHDVGVFVAGSQAALDGVIVRGTKPRVSDRGGGRGVSIGPSLSSNAPGSVTVNGSVVEDNHAFGVIVSGSQATLEGVVVRNTQPQELDGLYGRGAHIQPDLANAETAIAAIVSSLIEDNHEFGVIVSGSQATIESVVVRGTLAGESDGLFGDGVSVATSAPDDTLFLASAVVTYLRVEDGERAGLSNFGAEVALQASALSCNLFQLAGERHHELPYSFDDRGDNGCGCPEPTDPCVAESSGIASPDPLTGAL